MYISHSALIKTNVEQTVKSGRHAVDVSGAHGRRGRLCRQLSLETLYQLRRGRRCELTAPLSHCVDLVYQRQLMGTTFTRQRSVIKINTRLEVTVLYTQETPVKGKGVSGTPVSRFAPLTPSTHGPVIYPDPQGVITPSFHATPPNHLKFKGGYRGVFTGVFM